MNVWEQLFFIFILAAAGVGFWRLPKPHNQIVWPIDLFVFRSISLLLFANVVNQLALILGV